MLLGLLPLSNFLTEGSNNLVETSAEIKQKMQKQQAVLSFCVLCPLLLHYLDFECHAEGLDCCSVKIEFLNANVIPLLIPVDVFSQIPPK